MTELSIQIHNLFQKIQEVSKDYSDIKEILFDEYNIELMEDSLKTLKLLNNSRKAFGMMKFRFFLKGLNLNSIADTGIEKLIKYVNNEDKAEFITNSFDKILASNSKLACCIIGIILNDMIENEKNMEQDNLMILQALAMMNDFDIKNFVYIYDCLKDKKNNKYIRVPDKTIKNCAKLHNVLEDNIHLTMTVLEKYGLLEKEADVSLDMDSDDLELSSVNYDMGMYFNNLSEKLFKYASLIVNLQ